MKRLLSTLLIAFFVLSLQAQTFSGTVTDKENNPLEFVNVALFALPDSILVTGAVTNTNGEFSLDTNGKSGKDFILQCSFIGYKTSTVEAKGKQTIILEEDAQLLGEVVVSAARKIFKLENGSMVANVKNTVLETLTNANEVIGQLPFLSGRDGDFTVFGRGTPVIYINNRLVRDNKELEQLSPSDIKNIRVITSPGAAYDATVKAVIKITTERAVGEGLSGMFYGRLAQARVLSGSERVSLNYRTGAWDIFGSASVNQSNYNTTFDATQRLALPDNIQEQIYKNIEKGRSNRINPVVGVNFNPGDHLSMGIRYTHHNNIYKGDIKNDITHTANNVSENILQESTFRSPGNNHSINAYYNGKLSEKLAVNINSDIVTGNEEENMDAFYTQSPDKILRTYGTMDYDLYAVKGLLSYNINRGILDMGAEYTHTRVLQSYRINDPELGIDNTNDKAIQNRTALFASYQLQLEKVGITAGVRYENIVMDYFEGEVKNDTQSKKYNQFFPNISLSYTHDNLQTVVGFERKVNYPSYRQLRSNIQYSSPFIYESGNPLLQPHIENRFSLMLAQKEVQMMMGYSIDENAMFWVPQQFKEQPIILLRDENIRRSRSANLGLSYSPTFGVWRPRLEAGGMWQWLQLEGDVRKKYNTPIFSGKWFNTFSFPDKWTLRLDASGMSAGNSGVTYIQPSWGIDVRVTKQLFSDMLSIQLAATDILKTNRVNWEMDYGKINMLYDRDMDSRSVSLTVTYRFNSTSNKYKGQQTSDELNRL